MPFITYKGVQHYVPGVYDSHEVSSSLPGPLPALHIPVLLGRGWEGHPYNAQASKQDIEPDYNPWSRRNTESAVSGYFGQQSALHKAMQWAKMHGLPYAYVVNIAPITRASILVDAAGTEQCTLYAESWGAPANWLKINFTSPTLTITKPTYYAFFSANSGASDTRITVHGPVDWMVPGMTVEVGSNAAGAAVSRTIVSVGSELDANGQTSYWVELSSAPGALTTANYAVILYYPQTATETHTLVASTAYPINAQGFIDIINDKSQLLIAVKHANFDGTIPDNVGTTTALVKIADWSTVTAGTSPDATSTDYTNFVGLLNAGDWDAFVVQEQVIPHSYCLATGDSASHAVMRNYAIAERTRGYPIWVCAGVRWGDTSLSAGDDTEPTFRTAALDNQDFTLVGPGLNGLGPHLSMGPAVWALVVAGGPGHNLTNDNLLFAELEKKWDEIDSGELTALLRGGYCTTKLSVGQNIGYRVAQGLSTLQANNGAIWNEVDDTTWSIMQRHLADFVNRVIKRDFESLLVGADQVDESAVAAVLNRRAKKSLERRNFITSFRVTGITLNEAGSGFDVDWAVTLPVTNDYMTLTTTILLGA